MVRAGIKTLLLILPLTILIGSAFALDGKDKDKTERKSIIKWAVQKTSTLKILGSSNVNTFGCEVPGYYRPDTIVCYSDANTGRNIPLQGALEIDVLKFDCHNKILTSDLRKTLKADEYPKLTIRFISLERIPLLKENKDYLKGIVEVGLAGSSKRFEICYSFTKSGANTILLNGKRCFSFTDFSLTPPNKFAGLIKVKDRFDVDFNLTLNPVE